VEDEPRVAHASLAIVQDEVVPPQDTLDRAGVQRAHRAIESSIHRTPVFTSTLLSSFGTPILFKAENLQKGGAFKYRGASYNLSRLADDGGDVLSKGVCTHSSGNHASCLAVAAGRHGAKCYVVMVRVLLCLPPPPPFPKKEPHSHTVYV
jgi:threonine dehydratase